MDTTSRLKISILTAVMCAIVLGVFQIASLALASEPDKDEKMKTELDKLQGTWRFVRLEVDGSKVSEGAFAGAKIVVNGSSFQTVSMGAVYSGNLIVNVENSLKTLDMKFTEGPEQGNTSLAIYDLNGDTLRICLTVTSKTRPSEFATKAGSGLALETLKRESQEAKPANGATASAEAAGASVRLPP